MKRDKFHTGLERYLEDIEEEFNVVPEGRIKILTQLGDYMKSALNRDDPVRLVFICTHNSRRSQFGQIWAETAARSYGIRNVATFSGGTSSTAFHPHAVSALERAGFQVQKQAEDRDNPRYLVSSGVNDSGSYMYSKTYSDPANPAEEFCAIMVCSDADKGCPFIPGADIRISMPYDDPKAFDGTGQEKAKYDERCRQIAREMFFTFKYVKAGV